MDHRIEMKPVSANERQIQNTAIIGYISTKHQRSQGSAGVLFLFGCSYMFIC